MKAEIEHILQRSLPAELVSALLDAYFELKEHYYLGKHRPSELEGGRFSEVALRCVQHLGNGTCVPLNKRLNGFDKEVKALENAAGGKAHDSIRIHIPRQLLGIYGIRSRRNVGHVTPDINPNLADATVTVTVCDWVLAELIRLVRECPIEEAQAMVDRVVTRRIPIIQEFGSFLKVLNPRLPLPRKILALLYHRGPKGATARELKAWLKRVPANTFSASLWRLEHHRAHIHRADQICYITQEGMAEVERNLRQQIA